MTWHITPLDLARLDPVPAAVVGWPAPVSGSVLALPVTSYLVRRGSEVVLFDCGPPPPDEARAAGHVNVHHRWRSVFDALTSHGVAPADVDLVVLSHLHWDHVYGATGFPVAEVLVQRAEVDFRCHAPQAHRRAYDAGQLSSPADKVIDHPALRLIDDDHDLAPGLRVIATPGHTAGSQSLLVQAPRGPVALCGDAAHVLENVLGTGPDATAPIAPEILDDQAQWWASFDRIAAEGAAPVLAHDPRSIRAMEMGARLAHTATGFELRTPSGAIGIDSLGPGPVVTAPEVKKEVSR